MDKMLLCPTIYELHWKRKKSSSFLCFQVSVLCLVLKSTKLFLESIVQSHSLKMFNWNLHEHCAIITIIITLKGKTALFYFRDLNRFIKLSLKRLLPLTTWIRECCKSFSANTVCYKKNLIFDQNVMWSYDKLSTLSTPTKTDLTHISQMIFQNFP